MLRDAERKRAICDSIILFPSGNEKNQHYWLPFHRATKMYNTAPCCVHVQLQFDCTTLMSNKSVQALK